MDKAKENIRDNLLKFYDDFKPVNMDDIHKKINEAVYEYITEICDDHMSRSRKRYIDALASKVILNSRRYKDE